MKESTPVNDMIRARQVRLISEDGKQLGIFTLKRALEQAQSSDLDLVQMTPNADLVVGKLMNHGKSLFEKRKSRMQAKSKQRRVQVKEVKLRPFTGAGDQKTKMASIVHFLEEGNRVRLTVRFRGREVTHPDLGEKILNHMLDELGERGRVDQPIKMEGKQMSVLLVPPLSKKMRSKGDHREEEAHETEAENA